MPSKTYVPSPPAGRSLHTATLSPMWLHSVPHPPAPASAGACPPTWLGHACQGLPATLPCLLLTAEPAACTSQYESYAAAVRAINPVMVNPRYGPHHMCAQPYATPKRRLPGAACPLHAAAAADRARGPLQQSPGASACKHACMQAQCRLALLLLQPLQCTLLDACNMRLSPNNSPGTAAD
jgi:hypothetical protein